MKLIFKQLLLFYLSKQMQKHSLFGNVVRLRATSHILSFSFDCPFRINAVKWIRCKTFPTIPSILNFWSISCSQFLRAWFLVANKKPGFVKIFIIDRSWGTLYYRHRTCHGHPRRVIDLATVLKQIFFLCCTLLFS